MKRRNECDPFLLPGVAAALLVLALSAAPQGASARTYQPQQPNIPDGDPTADDQPSPAPKRAAPVLTRQTTSDRTHDWSTARLIWLVYVRAWIRIATL